MANFIGTTGADILDANTSGADLVSGGAGNDTLAYEFGKAGGADRYYGGTHTDVLELRFTQAEWDGLSSATKTSITTMKSAIAAAAKTNGAVAAGTKFGTLDFGGGKTVTVYEVESLKIMIDGVESDGTTPAPNKPVVVSSATAAGNVTEDGTTKATGTINFSDDNLADVHTATVTPANGQTALGMFSLSAVNETASTAAGSVGWTYTLDNASAAVQALTEDQTLVETYTVTISDGKGSSATQVITITIKGAADAAPVIETNVGEVVEAGIDEDGNAVTGPAKAAGKLAAAGVPANAAWSATDADENGAAEGTYGSLSVKNGVWTYTLDNTKAGELKFGDSFEESFEVKAEFIDQDGNAQEYEQTVTITVFGTDDKAVIGVDTTEPADYSIVEAGGINNAIDNDNTASGKLTVADQDDGDAAAFQVEAIAGKYGVLNIAADGTWTYTLDNDAEAVQKLTSGQQVADTLTVYSSDKTASKSITVNITGANDIGSIVIDDTVVGKGEVIEGNGPKNSVKDTVDHDEDATLENGDPNPNPTPEVSAFGKLKLNADPDGGAAAFKALTAAQMAGQYGSFALNVETGEWTYTLDEAKADALPATEMVEDEEGNQIPVDVVRTEKLVVYSADSLASLAIEVNIKGADDGPVSINSQLIDTLAIEDTDKDGDVAASGTVSVVDPDGGDAMVVVMEQDTNASVAKYGTFAFDGDTGEWTYSLDNALADSLKNGEIKTEKLVVVAKVDDEVYATKTILVSVKGANDKAEITVTPAAEDAQEFVIGQDEDGQDIIASLAVVVEAGGVNNTDNATDTAKGTAVVSDADTGETSFKTTAGSVKGDNKYGTFTFTKAEDDKNTADVDESKTTLNWSYKIDDQKALDHLRAGEFLTDKVTVKAADNTEKVIEIRIAGANDDATITHKVGSAGVAVKEAGGTDNKTAGDTKAGGTLTVSDPDGDVEKGFSAADLMTYGKADAGDGKSATDWAKTKFADLVGTATDLTAAKVVTAEDVDASNGALAAADVGKILGMFGVFSFDAESGVWAYDLKDSLSTTQQLDAGQKAVDTLVVKSLDGAASYQIVVEVTGAGDNATIVNTLDGTEPPADTSVAAGDDTQAGGQLMGTDPDAGAVGDDAADGYSELTFSQVATKLLAGKYGNFTFGTDGVWTYTLADGETGTAAQYAALTALTASSANIQDKLTVNSGGTAYTIAVNVKGADEALTVEDVAIGTGKVTYTAIDGDAGALKLQVKTPVLDSNGDPKLDDNGDPIFKITDLGTAVDGFGKTGDAAKSTFTLPTAAQKTLLTGELQVKDNTSDNAELLNTAVVLGTDKSESQTAAETDNGALMAGYGGADTLTGAAGTDYISGGTGNDRLNGADGADTLDGGSGNDVLTGGEGNDVFVFMTAASMGTTNFDTIADFTTGEDTLQLSMSLLPATYYKLVEGEVTAAKAFTDQAGPVVKGDVTTAWFREIDGVTQQMDSTGKAKFTLTAEDRFIFDTKTGTLWYDADGKSTTAATKVAVFADDMHPSADDFQFV